MQGIRRWITHLTYPQVTVNYSAFFLRFKKNLCKSRNLLSRWVPYDSVYYLKNLSALQTVLMIGDTSLSRRQFL